MLRSKPAEAGIDTGRRRISGLAARALLGGAAIALVRCGGGGPAAPPPVNDEVGLVAGDPTHSAVINGAQLSAGGALTLDIQGRADHSHEVELSAQDVRAVAAGQRVQRLSTRTNAHEHLVTFN